MLAILNFLKSVNFTDQMVYKLEIQLQLPVNVKAAADLLYYQTCCKSSLYYTLYSNITIGQKVTIIFADVSKKS